jgi:hypothetical protein
VITPLRCGVDTLEATFSGELTDDIVSELRTRKELAQAKDQAEELRLCNSMFHLLPKGAGLWPYVLRNDELIIRLGTASNVPAMSVRLLAEGLAGRGVDASWHDVREIAAELGLSYKNCSRLDVALDYQGHWFTFDEMLSVVCPASFRPIYPNTVKPETFQFGKGDIVVRVYNKSAEIEANSHRWWIFIWRLCTGYVESEPVYRVEVQMRGRVLKELGYRSVEDLITELPELFAHGLTWCSLRSPSEDTNKSRWPEDPHWTQLRTAFFPSRSLGRVRPISILIEYDACVRRFVSLMSSVGAATESEDFWGLCRSITTDAEQHIERELDTTYSALVDKKRKRKYL